MPRKRVFKTMNMTVEDHELISRIAAAEDRSMVAVVRRAIAAYAGTAA